MDKVFCIGFHKTGTSSLNVALTQLGYSVTGPNGVGDPDIAKNVDKLIEDLVPQFDAFQDNPWPVVYKALDERYPGSKFILTIRNPEKWIQSQVKHFGSKVTPMREWIYGVGCPKGNEAIYLDRYNKHNQEVREYFAGRENDLLTLNLEDRLEWNSICDFLNKPIPARAFPQVNKASERTYSSQVKKWMKRLIHK